MAVGPVGLPSTTWVPPVGFVWTSNSSTSPAAQFQNTSWSQLTNRFLIGAGGSYSLDSTGGSTTHTLTVAQMPAHSHSGSITAVGDHTHTGTYYADTGNGQFDYFDDASYRVYTTKSNEAAAATGAHTHTVTIGNTVSGNAFGIMNPYLGRYIWRRVS